MEKGKREVREECVCDCVYVLKIYKGEGGLVDAKRKEGNERKNSEQRLTFKMEG